MSQIWFERILRWRKKAQRFLQGRYARFDELNRTLLLTSVVLALINIFTGYLWVRLLILITVAYVYYRFFSKHIHTRLNENQRLMQKVHAFRKRHLTQKEYRYFKCPKCQQSLRAPKGRGTIKVTCSNCQNQFIKKV